MVESHRSSCCSTPTLNIFSDEKLFRACEIQRFSIDARFELIQIFNSVYHIRGITMVGYTLWWYSLINFKTPALFIFFTSENKTTLFNAVWYLVQLLSSERHDKLLLHKSKPFFLTYVLNDWYSHLKFRPEVVVGNAFRVIFYKLIFHRKL